MLKDLLPTLIEYGIRIIGVLIALWVSFRIANWAQSRVVATLGKRSFDKALTLFFGSLIRWLIVIAAVLACLSLFGIETTSFAAILGAASLAVGLAFQGTLSNFAAGIMLLTFRPFKIGDLVKLDGHVGTIQEIGLFTTALDTLDNRRIILANTTVTGGTIENISHNRVIRVEVDVGVAYHEDLDKVREILDQAAAKVPGRDDEAGHEIILLKLNESSIDWQVRVWCDPKIYWSVWDATVLATKKALDEAKVSIPFPQVDVHMDKSA